MRFIITALAFVLLGCSSSSSSGAQDAGADTAAVCTAVVAAACARLAECQPDGGTASECEQNAASSDLCSAERVPSNPQACIATIEKDSCAQVLALKLLSLCGDGG